MQWIPFEVLYGLLKPNLEFALDTKRFAVNIKQPVA